MINCSHVLYFSIYLATSAFNSLWEDCLSQPQKMIIFNLVDCMTPIVAFAFCVLWTTAIDKYKQLSKFLVLNATIITVEWIIVLCVFQKFDFLFLSLIFEKIFLSPIFATIDYMTIKELKANSQKDKYGQIRMFGALGYSTSFLVNHIFRKEEEVNPETVMSSYFTTQLINIGLISFFSSVLLHMYWEKILNWIDQIRARRTHLPISDDSDNENEDSQMGKSTNQSTILKSTSLLLQQDLIKIESVIKDNPPRIGQPFIFIQSALIFSLSFSQSSKQIYTGIFDAYPDDLTPITIMLCQGVLEVVVFLMHPKVHGWTCKFISKHSTRPFLRSSRLKRITGHRWLINISLLIVLITQTTLSICVILNLSPWTLILTQLLNAITNSIFLSSSIQILSYWNKEEIKAKPFGIFSGVYYILGPNLVCCLEKLFHNNGNLFISNFLIILNIYSFLCYIMEFFMWRMSGKNTE
jgi:hypothetical protein